MACMAKETEDNMSAKRDDRGIVFRIDEIGGVEILDGGRFLGVPDGALMTHETFRAKLAARTAARFRGKAARIIFCDFNRGKDGG